MHSAIGRLVYANAQFLRRKPVLRYLQELEASQYMDPGSIRELQLDRLRRLISYCYQRVPYYRELFDRHGFAPSSLRDFSDLAKLPPLTKQIVRDKGGEMLAASPARPIYFETTSGSTGLALTVGRDRTWAAANWAAAYRGRRWFGIDIGAPVAKIMRLPRAPRLLRAVRARLANEIWWNAEGICEEAVHAFYATCLRFRPHYFYGYPSHMLLLANSLRELGLPGDALGLRLMVCTGEGLQLHERRALESAFGATVANEYGSREAGVIAFDCPSGRMHIAAENVYLEVERDPSDAGRDGAGGLLVTSLQNFAMPLIRYRLGDLITLGTSPCPCGRGLPVLESVEGRIASCIRSANGKLVSSYALVGVVRAVLERGGDLRECQFEQRTGSTLVARVVKGPLFREETAVELGARLREIMGPATAIHIEFVAEIPPLPSGKRLFLVPRVAASGE